MPETGAKKWLITITVILCSMLELIDTSIVNVALAQVMGNLGATLGEVSWIVASYAIANVIVVPMAGWLSNQFGRRNYYAASVILFTAASFLCGNSTNICELVFFRFLQGMGGGALLATSQSILVETFPPQQLGLANGIFGLGVVIGPTLGPTLGGYIVDHFSWQWIFYVNIPIGILATFLCLTFISDSKHAKGKMAWSAVDWLGMGLLILGVGSLQLVLEQGEREDWFESTYIMAFSLVSIIGIVGFIWRELTAKNPIVNLRILKDRNLAVGTGLSFILGFGLFSTVFILPVFLQRVLGLTATQTGEMFFPGAIATGFMMPIVGRLIQKGASQKLMIPIGFFIFFVFTFWMTGLITPTSSDCDFFWPLIFRGFGMGLLFVPLTTLSLSNLKGADIPQGAGLTNMLRQLGGSFGVAIVSTYIERTTFGHRTDLLNNINNYDTETLSRLSQLTHAFIAKGSSLITANEQALKALDLLVTKQAMILTYIQTLLMLGVFFLLCIPLVLLIKKPKSKVNFADAAH